MEENSSLIPIIIRPALKRACCENDACRAAIYNQLLYSIARKAQDGGEYWFGTHKDIWNVLDQSWGLSKVIKEIDNLVQQGYIKQRRNPKNGYDQTRQYLFGQEEAEKFKLACEKAGVCVHQMGFGNDVLHLLKITNAFTDSNNCICLNQQIDLVNSTNRFVENNAAIPKSTTKNTSKNTKQESTNAASADANDHSSLLTEKEKEIVRWFCEIVGVSVTLTASGIASTQKISAHIETKEHLQSLYEVVRKKMEGKKDPTVYLANLKDGLQTWIQQKPAPAPIVEEEKKIDPNSKVFWARNYRNLRGELANSFWMFEEIRFGDLDVQNQQLYLEEGPIAEGQKAKIDLFKKRWQNGESLPASINPPPCPVAV